MDRAGNAVHDHVSAFEFLGTSNNDCGRPGPERDQAAAARASTTSSSPAASRRSPSTRPTPAGQHLLRRVGQRRHLEDDRRRQRLDAADGRPSSTPRATRASVPIGALAVSPANPNILYAGTGVADHQLDSRPGVGILKSIDGGRRGRDRQQHAPSWPTPASARSSIDANDARHRLRRRRLRRAAAGRASTRRGRRRDLDQRPDPGADVPSGGSTVPAGTAWPRSPTWSSTRSTATACWSAWATSAWRRRRHRTAGVWSTSLTSRAGAPGTRSSAATTAPVPNDTLPSGQQFGRVTLAMGQGRVGDEDYVYVLIGSPPPGAAPAPDRYNTGNFHAPVCTRPRTTAQLHQGQAAQNVGSSSRLRSSATSNPGQRGLRRRGPGRRPDQPGHRLRRRLDPLLAAAASVPPRRHPNMRNADSASMPCPYQCQPDHQRRRRHRLRLLRRAQRRRQRQSGSTPGSTTEQPTAQKHAEQRQQGRRRLGRPADQRDRGYGFDGFRPRRHPHPDVRQPGPAAGRHRERPLPRQAAGLRAVQGDGERLTYDPRYERFETDFGF